MSRSIHATLREPRDLGDLERKRRIKKLVGVERRGPEHSVPFVSEEAVAITVRGRGDRVRFPASAEDVLALIARLPVGSARGVGRIELGINEADELCEVAAGIFSGRTRGCYIPDGATIKIYGYVYAPERRDRAVVETYLRLEMLSTLVHELGHHADFLTRVARGRWCADDEEELEVHAEAIQYLWTRDYVVPYIEEMYSDDVRELERWLEAHGGIALPLQVLAGDPRTTRGVDGERLFFSVGSAFESLLDAIATGERPPATQVAFANDLHYGTNYDEALAILARVLDEHVGHVDARVLRADIFVHQGRLDEADAIAQGLVQDDNANGHAWQIVADVARARGDWRSVLQATLRIANLQDCLPNERWLNLELTARARIELGDLDGAQNDIDELATRARVHQERRVETLRCLLLVRREFWEDALVSARSILAAGRPLSDVVAARFEAAHRLLRPAEAGELCDATCDSLRRGGYSAWVERLQAFVSTG